MNIFSEVEIQKITIYLGSRIRLERLKANLSQYDLAINCGLDNTAIGRIERGEHKSSWEYVLQIAKFLNINVAELFQVKSKRDLIDIVNECHSLDSKLTKEKESYYSKLIERIKKLP